MKCVGPQIGAPASLSIWAHGQSQSTLSGYTQSPRAFGSKFAVHWTEPSGSDIGQNASGSAAHPLRNELQAPALHSQTSRQSGRPESPNQHTRSAALHKSPTCGSFVGHDATPPSLEASFPSLPAPHAVQVMVGIPPQQEVTAATARTMQRAPTRNVRSFVRLEQQITAPPSRLERNAVWNPEERSTIDSLRCMRTLSTDRLHTRELEPELDRNRTALRCPRTEGLSR